MVQGIVGSEYSVTGDESQIERALADEETIAIVLIRGRAWFTRILARLDLSPLERRARRIALFGFSELTTPVNLVAASRRGLGIYDMGPGF